MEVKSEHYPVMLSEVVEEFSDFKDSVVVDGTVGRGGHFFNILSICNTVVGLDYNFDSIQDVTKILEDKGYENKGKYYSSNGKKAYLVRDNFANLVDVVSKLGLSRPEVVFIDLGVSLYQIKRSGVGLSFMALDEDLDMRVDSSRSIKASDLLNGLSRSELEELFSNLGEVRNYKSLAKQIVQYRINKKIVTVGDFVEAGNFKKLHGKTHTATKPFMALRIAVNSEHLNFKDFLHIVSGYINEGTKLVVLTFHSLEQKTLVDFCKKFDYRVKVTEPSSLEVAKNASSRSAYLNVIVKNAKK